MDYAALYRAHMQQSRRLPKPAQEWDKRAADYMKEGAGDNYVADFLARMDLTGVESVLDVGCGAGALALPLAGKVAQVIALDYSQGMLQQLQAMAVERGLCNITTVHRAWEDDWQDVPVCDIAIASRSTLVEDMADALAKLNRHASKRVYLTYLVDGYFMDPEILAMAGALPPAAPDYLWVLGVARQLGVLPKLDYIVIPSRLAGCADFDELLTRLQKSTGKLDTAARTRFLEWYAADPVRAFRGGAPMRWAFIYWDVKNK
jgi:SAM-dependent methyltransferase